jgi:AraC-like DNA-binding protein
MMMGEEITTYPKIYLYKRIVQSKLFIDSNFSSPIDLENIADEASFSKFHFIRLFKSIYGKTPHQYLIQVRIDKAIIFLQEGRSVNEVCELVGFESISSFTGLFKRKIGCTPSAWQQQWVERKEQISAKPLRFIPNCFAEQNGW